MKYSIEQQWSGGRSGGNKSA